MHAEKAARPLRKGSKIYIQGRMTYPTVLELGELSRRHLGIDLSMYHAHPLPEFDAKPGSLDAPMADVAARIIPRVLHQVAEYMPSSNTLMFQCSTRELLPDDPDDALTIDATRLFASRSVAHTQTWSQLASALFLIKQQISQQIGRPRLRIHGSKHLTTATLLGHVFRAASGFQIELRQKEMFWATDYPPIPTPPFTVVEDPGSYHTASLFIEIDALNKPVRDSVRRYIQQTDVYPTLSLRFNRVTGPLGQGAIDNAQCCAMAWQIRHAVSATIAQNDIVDIHLFGTMPQSLAMMIGYHLNALRPVQLYEYVHGDYQPSYRLSNDQL